MKKQSGFTLIELMVVMAIIAILATAGLSAYTGYIKKARDSKRLTDISAINTIILATMSGWWSPPATAKAVYDAIIDANNSLPIVDPLTSPTAPTVNKSVCNTVSWTASSTKECAYTYRLCDNGQWFAVGTRFESSSNVALQASDDITVGSGTLAVPIGASIFEAWTGVDGYKDADIYEVGSCLTACPGVTGTFIDTAGLCTSATTDPVVPIKLDGSALGAAFSATASGAKLGM